MRLRELYEKAVKLGMEKDPRAKEEIERVLEEERKKFEQLDEVEKEVYDKERLNHPYHDTRILNGDGNEEVKRIIVGIDMEIGELLLADRLKEKGERIDAVVAHHPEGKGYAKLADVMAMQADIFYRFGVPINVAEKLTGERMKEVERRVMPVNHYRAVDAARLLRIPFMNIHTPSDNFATSYLQELFDREKPVRLKDVIALLLEIPEYRKSAELGVSPSIIAGTRESRVGRVFVDMTGGTEGSKALIEKVAQAGVGTIVAMHMSEEHRKEVEKNKLNLVIAGHISSDSLGLNLLFDTIRRDAELEIIPCSGYIRVERNL